MRRVLALAALLTAWQAVVPLAARTQAVSPEYQLKGAFVFNVLNFVEWPPAALPAGTPLRLTVVASAPLPGFAAAFAGRSVKGRPVVVETVRSADQLPPSHAVFVAAEAVPQLRAVLRSTGGGAVLTVVEQPLDVESPAVLTLGVVQQKLAFQVNLDSADAAGLQVNPNLLKLARAVQSARVRSAAR